MKGIIKNSTIKVLNNRSITFKKPLFLDINGSPVYSGDTVEFYPKGQIHPSNGTVSNLYGLRIDCFNTFLNKWEYYQIKLT